MIPLRLELENFLSFGSPAVEFDFTDAPLWVLSGPNGVGKSAVFDAITYALFGQHRGGVQGAAQLVRHGTNGLRVVFTFEHAGQTYRVSRSRPGGGAAPPPPLVERLDGDAPVTIDLSPYRTAARVDAVNLWAEATLGIGFHAFTASVLLRQGEADAMIKGGNTERLALLKKVIGVEHYEQLSVCVHEATKVRKNHLEGLQARLGTLPAVGDEEVRQAQALLDEAQRECETARRRESTATTRVEQAKQWVQATQRQGQLRQLIEAAAARKARAAQLCTDHARLLDLNEVVPSLTRLLTLTREIESARPEVERLAADIRAFEQQGDEAAKDARAAEAAAARHRERAIDLEHRVKEMSGQAERDAEALKAVKALAELDRQVGDYPADLAGQVSEAEQRLQQAEEAEKHHTIEATLAAERLKQVARQREQFGRVDVGIPCARCGQPVTEEHAARERDRLDAEHEACYRAEQHARQTLREAHQTCSTARTTRQTLADQLRKLQVLQQTIASQRQALEGFGYAMTGDALEARLLQGRKDRDEQAKERDRERSTQQHLEGEKKRHDRERNACQTKVDALRKEHSRLETSLATLEGGRAAVRGALPAGWAERTAELAALERERQDLECRGVAAEYARLVEEQAKVDAWRDEAGRIERTMADLPADARISEGEAARLLTEAAAAASDAGRARDQAARRLDQVQRQAEEYRDLGQQLRAAERQHHLHARLDDLLGKKGLQRELVRTAEREIVRLADDTLGKLSDGELTVELGAEKSGDETFALCVRLGDDPVPIAVEFLSGSQRFRVAMAVALAIGRFASGQAHPLDAVIIDEGFGCLDRDGLRATADELNSLKRFLKRIILVSHQEEFAACFPGGYRLRRTAEGTAAERYLN